MSPPSKHNSANQLEKNTQHAASANIAGSQTGPHDIQDQNAFSSLPFYVPSNTFQPATVSNAPFGYYAETLTSEEVQKTSNGKRKPHERKRRRKRVRNHRRKAEEKQRKSYGMCTQDAASANMGGSQAGPHDLQEQNEFSSLQSSVPSHIFQPPTVGRNAPFSYYADTQHAASANITDSQARPHDLQEQNVFSSLPSSVPSHTWQPPTVMRNAPFGYLAGVEALQPRHTVMHEEQWQSNITFPTVGEESMHVTPPSCHKSSIATSRPQQVDNMKEHEEQCRIDSVEPMRHRIPPVVQNPNPWKRDGLVISKQKYRLEFIRKATKKETTTSQQEQDNETSAAERSDVHGNLAKDSRRTVQDPMNSTPSSFAQIPPVVQNPNPWKSHDLVMPNQQCRLEFMQKATKEETTTSGQEQDNEASAVEMFDVLLNLPQGCSSMVQDLIHFTPVVQPSTYVQDFVDSALIYLEEMEKDKKEEQHDINEEKN